MMIKYLQFVSAANNTKIATYGERSLTLDLGLHRTFRWVFLIADVTNPILGGDFLHHFQMLVDVSHARPLDSLTHLQLPGQYSKTTSLHLYFFNSSNSKEFAKILCEFPTQVKSCSTNLKEPPKLLCCTEIFLYPKFTIHQ